MQISPLLCCPTCSAFSPFLNACPSVMRHAWPYYGETGFLPTSQLWWDLEGTGKPSSAQCQPTGDSEIIVLLTMLLNCMIHISWNSRVILYLPTILIAQPYWCETSSSCLSCYISCIYYPSWSIAAARVTRIQNSLQAYLYFFLYGTMEMVYEAVRMQSMIICTATVTDGPRWFLIISEAKRSLIFIEKRNL